MAKKKEEPKEVQTIADGPMIIEDSIKYKLQISEEGYQLEYQPSISADLVGLIMAKKVHEAMMIDIEKLKEIGIQPQFKQVFNNRYKDLKKSIYTLNYSIQHVLKFATKEVSK